MTKLLPTTQGGSGCGRLRRGFTLLELLVSMVILSVIVLVTSQLFNQMTTAWDSGTRKAELTMTGRALVDFMAQELSQAVYDGNIFTDTDMGGGAEWLNRLSDGAQGVRFYTIEEAPSGTNRAARIIRYSYNGSRKTVQRVCELWSADNVYSNLSWHNPATREVMDMAGDVRSLKFYPYWKPGVPGALPLYVDVRVEVARDEDMKRGYDRLVFESRAYIANRHRYRFE